MKKIIALALGQTTTSTYAGFGGMGNIESESSGSLSDIVWGALIIGGLWWAYTAWRDRP